MEHSENIFKVLDVLYKHDITTQRQLSKYAGISLGQVNYVLKNLLERGLVKLGNFRKNPHKIGYAYLLTPKGIETKSLLAVKFITSKLKEYHDLRTRLAEKLCEIEKKALLKIIFVGPQMIKDFLESIIKENNLKLILAGYCQNWEDLHSYHPDSYDVVLYANADKGDLKTIKESGISWRNKMIPVL